jgi:hypothetical protein
MTLEVYYTVLHPDLGRSETVTRGPELDALIIDYHRCRYLSAREIKISAQISGMGPAIRRSGFSRVDKVGEMGAGAGRAGCPTPPE